MNKSKAEVKTERVLAVLEHREPDRIPITDGFWSLFLKRWLNEKELSPDTNIYRYYDLDMICVAPNLDPHIARAQEIEKTQDYVIYKSGWGSIIKKEFAAPMPYFLEFSAKSAQDYEKFVFDDPLDSRRYFDERDDLINTGDSYGVIPSFKDIVDDYREDFFLVGGVCEPFETLWRIRGTEGALMDLVLYPDETKSFIDRITDFMLAAGKRQLELCHFKGMIIWGDVAYDKGMFFSPKIWEEMFYPSVKRMCDEFHKMGAKVIYHGCGNSLAIMDKLIEAGIDVYNPLEVKAGMDVVELKRKYGTRLSFYGNIDVRILAQPDKELIKKEVLRKLNAAKGGGYIIASDHSVAANVPLENYEYMVQLVRQYGNYPLDLGEYDMGL